MKPFKRNSEGKEFYLCDNCKIVLFCLRFFGINHLVFDIKNVWLALGLTLHAGASQPRNKTDKGLFKRLKNTDTISGFIFFGQFFSPPF